MAGDAGGLVELVQGEGRHRVLLRLWDTGGGWTGSLTGGEAPHVGGVVLCVPRPSLTGEGTSCDRWLIPVPGHKDLEVAAPLAERICAARGVCVSLSAGIHVDNATPEDIRILADNCRVLGDRFLRETGPGHTPK